MNSHDEDYENLFLRMFMCTKLSEYMHYIIKQKNTLLSKTKFYLHTTDLKQDKIIFFTCIFKLCLTRIALPLYIVTITGIKNIMVIYFIEIVQYIVLAA